MNDYSTFYHKMSGSSSNFTSAWSYKTEPFSDVELIDRFCFVEEHLDELSGFLLRCRFCGACVKHEENAVDDDAERLFDLLPDSMKQHKSDCLHETEFVARKIALKLSDKKSKK